MPGIDVSMKHAIAEFPEDWAEFVGVRKGTHVRVVDSDVSTVATLTDKVIEVGGEKPFVLHLEPQSYYDKGLDVRMFEANGRLTKRHGRFVHTCVVLLDRSAWGRANSGRYQSESPLGGCRVDFQYQVIKVWELPVERLLSAGVGVILLAPVSDISRAKVSAVIDQMAQRFRQEVPRAVEAELWTATYTLVGLRYDKLIARSLLRGVREIMKESVTYQEIVDEGRAKGRLEKGREDILRIGTKRFGKPPRKARETIARINDVDHVNAILDRVLEVSNWMELLDE